MLKYTNEQILAKCQSIWDAQHKKHYCMGWEKDGCIEVLSNKTENVVIKLHCMYESPAINIDILTQLAEFFGTKNINDDDRFGICGCETCDYGSSYGFNLTVRPESAN